MKIHLPLLLLLPFFAALTLATAQTDESYRVIYSFRGGPADGASPLTSSLSLDREHNLYGTTYLGGAAGFGTIFKVGPDGTETVLYSFGGAEGANPFAGIVYRNASAEFLGSTSHGGLSSNCEDGCGVLYSLKADGTLTVLHSFDGSVDGSSPIGTLVHGDGMLYGVAENGGADGNGTIYRLTLEGAFSIVHTFLGSDGRYPYARLTKDNAGNLYGTCSGGGANNDGTLFEVSANGSFIVRHDFKSSTDGGGPSGGVVIDAAGNLFGTAYYGGTNSDYGTVWKLTPDNTYTVLYVFPEFEGAPEGDLIEIDGKLYGTNEYGGDYGLGAVYEVSMDGTIRILHSFPADSGDGFNPHADVIKGDGRFLYGTTGQGGDYGFGTVYKVRY